MQITGAVDEAQAVMGLARAETEPDSELDRLLTRLERDLYVVMADWPPIRPGGRLTPATPWSPPEMVVDLEGNIDELKARFEMPGTSWYPGPTGPRPRWTWPEPWSDGPKGGRVGTGGRVRWARTSTACPTCCGPWPAGRRVTIISWPEPGGGEGRSAGRRRGRPPRRLNRTRKGSS